MFQSVVTHGKLLDLSSPRVMAILNFTTDSFYTSCSTLAEKEILGLASNAIEQGADILDLGACSTRPNSSPVSEDEEWKRVSYALQVIRYHWKDVIISIDTFRVAVAQGALALGADMINDVSGGGVDFSMWDLVCAARVPYILTHSLEISLSKNETYNNVLSEMLDFFQRGLDKLYRQGVSDVIIDPGFGFGKTIEQNYTILRGLEIFQELHVPILVGLSRKSMFYKALSVTPNDVLPATTAAHMLALQRGAHLLRVHDVAAAKQAIKIFQLDKNE